MVMDFDFDGDCDGFGFGWIFPAFLIGKLVSEAFDRPKAESPFRERTWPAPPPANPVSQPSAIAALGPQNTLHCQNCHKAISANFAFCPHCGTRVAPPVCRYCGQTLQRDMAYCTHCGGPTR
jgi:RNA polymerase subunit RPABC4/transcription elongation factor Spt4